MTSQGGPYLLPDHGDRNRLPLQLPVECTARILSWLVDEYRWIDLLSARLVSMLWVKAVSELMEWRMSDEDERYGEEEELVWVPRYCLSKKWHRLALVCVPYMSDSFLETCQQVDFSRLRGQVENRTIYELTKIPNLQAVNLSWCEQITDSAVAELATSAPNLTSLQLASCTSLTDGAISEAARLPQLTSLDVSWCKSVTESGIRHLARFRCLKSLSLSGCNRVYWSNLSDFPQIVALLPHLTTLNLSSSNITYESVKELANLPSLTDLRLSGCKLFLANVWPSCRGSPA
jgi:hypothetical protein